MSDPAAAKGGVTPLALPPRSVKPRTRGLTSMIDFGPDTFGWTGATGGIEPLLEACAAYIDFAKIYALNALLLPRDVVRAAARCYRDHDVVPFAGGILFEYAWQRNELDGLEALLDDLALGALEISENYVSLTPVERARAIDRFQKRGLQIKYEFGRKNPTDPLSLDELGAVVDAVGRQGIEHVIVEQSDFDMLLAARADAIDRLQEQPWFERLIIEADPYRFPKQHAELVQTFGAEVNLANITPGQVLRLEGFRRGIGRAVDYAIILR
ncbi:MAG: phosphosulfolactate synthase [Proteobacteria bacterium]|nr:phosphosulfolactate synthase [Burkholderiales bacterium]